MKNLLIYIGKFDCFDYEHETLVKIQIDNSLALGWKREDIILATNFSYEYRGIKSLKVSRDNYCSFCPTVSKINTILGILGNDTYWFHDFDAYQLEKIEEKKADLSLTDYGSMPRWSTGSMFFNKKAKDIFEKVRDICYQYKTNEERALWALTGNDTVSVAGGDVLIKGCADEDIAKRIKKINISYNFQARNIKKCFPVAEKPIEVVHFHLIRPMIDFFIKGDNKINEVLVNQRLSKIFKNYGIE